MLLDDLQEWKRPNLYEDRPSPMVIEIYLDIGSLSQNESLVIVDDNGNRTEVVEALSTSAGSSPHPTKHGGKAGEVVLERWTVELGSPEGYTSAERKDPLPNVYKKGVVLFRSLYTFLRYLPAWKLYRRLGRHAGNHHALKMKFRIRQGRGLASQKNDSLYRPLCQSDRDTNNINDVVGNHEFPGLDTSSGRLFLRCAFRRVCRFSVLSHERLLSSRFLGQDSRVLGQDEDETEQFNTVGRSLPGERTQQPRERYSRTAVPTTTARDRPRGLLGAYGSLGTFHSTEKRNSPVSELRQLALESDYEDDMQRIDTIRAEEGVWRRRPASYVEQPPFKAGSLASSPRPTPSPSTSAGRNESALFRYGSAATSSSKRTSLNALPQQQLRTPPLPNEFAVASSGSTSPKPAPVRYSSSFAGRNRRFPSQSSKAAESNTSSGRGSSDSREKPDQPIEGTAGDSSSNKTDEDDIASFISDLEKSKDIKFHTPPSNRDNVVNLSKYSQLRDPNAQLADEMSSSSLIQTSVTPPSRRLSNVPGLSVSSSPSRALTHAPHVRSRLSTSIVEEQTQASRASGASGEGSESPNIAEAEEEDDEELPFIFPHDNDNDIID